MIEFIVLIIFLLSVVGILIIIFRKLPVLITLPKNGRPGLKKSKIIQATENKIKNFSPFFTDGKFLHKFFSCLKCQILRIEYWIDSVLHGIRKKAKEDKLNKKK